MVEQLARCDACNDFIRAMTAVGYVYSARQQNNEAWNVSFLPRDPQAPLLRASASTTHEALAAIQKMVASEAL